MTLAKVMNKLLMTNLIKFVPLNLSIQNKYLYGSVQHSFILFYSHTFQSQPSSGCKYTILKEGKNYDVQYIILFMFLWDPTSSPIFLQ